MLLKIINDFMALLVHQYILNIIEHQKVGEAVLTTEPQEDLHSQRITFILRANMGGVGTRNVSRHVG
jgi:hypothetical protein